MVTHHMKKNLLPGRLSLMPVVTVVLVACPDYDLR